jgi:hypothetical protein
MGSFTITGQGVLSEPRQEVRVNGIRRPDVICASVKRGLGSGGGLAIQGSAAVFRFPRARVDDELDWLADAEIEVYGSDRSGASATERGVVFRGYVSLDSRKLDSETDEVRFTARSVLAILADPHGVYVGQGAGVGTVRYPRYDRYTGAETGWTLDGIIQDLFASGVLPDAWRGKVRLGSLDGARRAGQRIQMPDITFRAASYGAALRKLLELAPDVWVRERYGPTITYLDFGQFGRPAGLRTLRAPTATEQTAGGAMLAASEMDSDNSQIVSRVVGFGAGVETMLTTGTVDPPPPWPAVSAAYLEPDWGDASPYPLGLGESLTPAEQDVLDYPDLANLSKPGYNPLYSQIFRRFRLPECLRTLDVQGNNTAIDGSGQRVKLQVFGERRTYDERLDGEGKPTGAFDGTVDPSGFDLLNFSFDNRSKILTLHDPAIAAGSYEWSETLKRAGAVNVRRNIWITLTVKEDEQNALKFDTGTLGNIGYPGFGTEGIVFSFNNPQLEYRQVGSVAGQFRDSTGAGFGFGALWVDSWDGTWYSVGIDAPMVIRNDAPWLAQLCNSYLAERLRRRRTFLLNLDGMLFGLLPGDGVRLLNVGADGDQFTVLGIYWRMTGGRFGTEILLSNEVPGVADSVFSSALAQRGETRRRTVGSALPGDEPEQWSVSPADVGAAAQNWIGQAGRLATGAYRQSGLPSIVGGLGRAAQMGRRLL